MSLQEKIREMKQICGIQDVDISMTDGTGDKNVDLRRNIEESQFTEVSESLATTVKQERQTNMINLTQQPKILVGGILKSYQLESLQFLLNIHAMSMKYNSHFVSNGVKKPLEYQINAILADEMGLGKTIQTLSLLCAVQEFYGIKGKHMIIVPKSTIIQWEQEQQKWCPSYRLIKLIGEKEERQEVLTSIIKPQRFDILLTTYDQVRIEQNTLQKIHFSYVVMDEGHKLKDIESQISSVIRSLQADHLLLLTGTPIQNNLHELWSLLNCLMPYLFNNPTEFVSVLQQAENADQLQEILKLFLIRREKKDVETLPDKHEYLIHCPMTKLQKRLYKGILMKDLDQLSSAVNTKSADLGKTSLLNILMQLRKCADHPYLFSGVEPEPFIDGPHLYNCAGKMVVLQQLIQKILARKEKVLIFCQMTTMLNIISDFLNITNISHCRIDGSTQLDERAHFMKEFMTNVDKYPVFLLSTRAGCLGLNLTAANHVIIYQQDFNPQVDAQAIGRAYRILQKREVHVYRLVTENSVDVKIYERSVVKMQLDELIIQNGNFSGQDISADVTSKKTSKNNLMDMIAFQTDQLFEEKDEQAENQILDYNQPEIVFSDEKMQELLKDASIFQEQTVQTAEQIKTKASEVINKLASDGKLESFDAKELYKFDGEDFAKHNIKKLTQQMYKEKMAKLEEDRLAKRFYPDQEEFQEAKGDKRWYPSMAKFRKNQSLYKPDIYLLDKHFYQLQTKVTNEITKVIEPYFQKNKDVTFEEYIEQIQAKKPEQYQLKYTNIHLPGLTEDEAIQYLSYCEQNCPYINNKEISKKDFTFILQSICDYDPSLYPEDTGVRRIKYITAQEQKEINNPVLGYTLFPMELLSQSDYTILDGKEIDVTGIEDLSLSYDHFISCYTKQQAPLDETEYRMYCEALVQNLGVLEESQKIKNRIEKARQKRTQYFQKIKSLRLYIESYNPDALLTMKIPSIQQQKRVFTTLHDRFLLIATDIFGFGCWEEIVALIRVHPMFIFDWWFKARDEGEISSRVDKLIKAIQRDTSA
ncbi:putative DNA-dependent ATPase [Spironucleus salmonicida]|uniref:DNA-dependent ATPase n=1 Tax=Spironucleus salmonicida TaxID=348837 RepID=V6LWA5_9EUKA|nr:putative DNA-dependent ATPase [Spironucleus salmonicida]|eukprot:EST45094.1 SNF2 family N-terminal domain, Helicase C-terminal domain and a SLIDE domain-containing protein [Spironucleus salmonicida]